MGRLSETIEGLKPAMMMVAVQALLAGVNIFYKLAGNIGMSLSVLIAYRFLFATVSIVPLALFIERKSRPKLTWVVVCQAFLCGLLGTSLAQNLYAKSLVLTSATFASAMTNLIPAITLILSVSFGMERLGFSTLAGKAKVVGKLLCIGGAMLLTFYKGAEINLWSTRVDLLHTAQNQGGHVAASHQKAGDPVLGALLVGGFCFSMAMALIIQAKMMRIYPCPYSITAMMITFGAIQAVGFSLCTEKDWSQWRLGWDIRLLTVSYTGIVASGAMFTLMAWCVHVRGPLFVSVFNPLMLVLVAIAGSLVLDEKLHLGTVLGAVVIICGLYMVLWGKSKELKTISELMPSKSSRESESKELKRISQVMPSECIDIIIAASSAENSKRNSSCRSINALVLIPNDVSMAYNLDDPFEEEIQEQVEEEDDDDCDNEEKERVQRPMRKFKHRS